MFNLYKILLSEEYSRVLNEGKDPIAFIHSKFDGVVDPSLVDDILEIDPTKKKSYTFWALNSTQGVRGKINLLEKRLADGRLKRLFDFAKENNDFQLQTFDGLTQAFKAMESFGKENEYEVVYKSDEWDIYIPRTYEAARKLGKYTDWCTASDENGRYDGREMFNRYSSYGPLYINVDKTSTERRACGEDSNGNEVYREMPKRYQFLFEYEDSNIIGMLCDSDDNNLAEYGEEIPQMINMPLEVVEFYNKQGYDFGDLDVEKRNKRKMAECNEERETTKIVLHEFNDGYLVLLNTYNYETYEVNKTEYLLFDTRNGTEMGQEIIDSTFVGDDYYDIVRFSKENTKVLEASDDTYAVIVISNAYEFGYKADDDISTYVTFGDKGLAFSKDSDKIHFLTIYGYNYIQYNYYIDNIEIPYGFPNDRLYVQGNFEYNGGSCLVSYGSDREITEIIHCDKPLSTDGTFQCDENGTVRCKYRTYNINGGNNGEGDDDWMVMETPEEEFAYIRNSEGLYNILMTSDEGNYILSPNQWFSKIDRYYTDVFVVTYPNKKYGFIKFDGSQLCDMLFELVSYHTINDSFGDSYLSVSYNGEYNMVCVYSINDERYGLVFDKFSTIRPQTVIAASRNIVSYGQGRSENFEKAVHYNFFDLAKREFLFQEPCNGYSSLSDNLLLLKYNFNNGMKAFMIFRPNERRYENWLPIPYDELTAVFNGANQPYITFMKNGVQYEFRLSDSDIVFSNGRQVSIKDLYQTNESVRKKFNDTLRRINEVKRYLL